MNLSGIQGASTAELSLCRQFAAGQLLTRRILLVFVMQAGHTGRTLPACFGEIRRKTQVDRSGGVAQLVRAAES